MIFGQTQQVSPITAEELGHVMETRETPAGEYFSAVVGDAFEHSLPGAMWAEIKLPDDDLTGQRDIAAQEAFVREHHRFPMTKEEILSVMERSNVPTMTQEEWNASPYYRKEIPFDGRMTEARAKAKAEVYDEDQHRAWLRQNRPWGVGTIAMAVAGSLVGSAPDPVNYIPGFGVAFKAANATRISVLMTRAGLGVLDSSITTAITEPIIANSRRQFGDDMSFADQVMDVAFGAALGGIAGGIHGGFEHIPQAITERHPAHVATALQALGEVADAVANDRPLERETGAATASVTSLRQEIRSAIQLAEQDWANRIAAGWTPPKKGGGGLAAAKGRAAHAVLRAWVRRKAETKPGWVYEPSYWGQNGQQYKPDVRTPRRYIFEMKPRTEFGKIKGEKQAQTYRAVSGERVESYLLRPMKKKKLHEFARELKDILSPLGFSRKGSTWTRDNGWCIDVIEFQIASLGGAFTINVGVLTKSVLATAWGREPPASLKAAHCTVESRLGELAGHGDKWWDTDDENFLAEAGPEIISGALPFHERMHDPREQRRFLEERFPRNRSTPVTAYIAILMFEGGEREEGCSLLRDFRQKHGEDWVDWRAAVLARLGCPKS